MMYCDFRRNADDDKWVCLVCGAKAKAKFDHPPIARCGIAKRTGLGVINSGNSCPFASIATRLTPTGLAGLDRCRAANCGMMHRVNGAITCVGMQGRKCGWLTHWGRCLNREEEFGCGGCECPHWLNANDHAEQHQQANQHDDGTSATHCVVAEFME